MTSQTRTIAEVVAASAAEDTLQVTLRIHPVPFDPVAPASLYAGENYDVRVLDLHRVIRREGDEITFESFDLAAVLPAAGDTYLFSAWWVPWQLEVARVPVTKWHRQAFQPEDAISYPGDGFNLRGKASQSATPPIPDVKPGSVMPGGGEHEHCRFCFQTISPADGDPHAGYTDGDNWLCEPCFERFIVSGLGAKLGDHG